MKILFLTNIPSPYRIDFFNELGKSVDLTVIFEAESADGITFNWNLNEIKWFKAIFLKEGNIEEKTVNWQVLKYVKKNEYDVIIVTSYAYYTEMLSLLALKIKRIPYFLEIDGGLIRKENILKKVYKTFLISNAKGYVSPSNFSDLYLTYYGAESEKIFRYPFTSLKNVDIQQSLISREEKLKVRKDLLINEDKIVLTVGQFIHRKGFDILLNACKKIGKDVGVYIVGGEPTKEYLDLKNSLGLNNVHFCGFKTKEELAKYYRAADVFVFPTREDVWGLVINEAMAHGLPIITTDKCIAGVELVKDNINGFIIPTENQEILGNKIIQILSDEDALQKMSLESLKNIKDYTIENMSMRHLEIFNKIIDGGKYEG